MPRLSFVHLFCAVWHYELVFEDVARLDHVHGVESLDQVKLEQVSLAFSYEYVRLRVRLVDMRPLRR